MLPASVDELVDLLQNRHLLQPARADEPAACDELRRSFQEPRRLVQHLTRNGWLTGYQAHHLVHGELDKLVFGPYRLLDRLGQGSSSRVFRAWDVRRREIVALKVLNDLALKDDEALTRFRREIRAAKRLDHPNIVRALDAHLSASCGFLAMEYVGGVDLRELMTKQGPLPVEMACNYAKQAAQGLQHAHEHGIVHRDVKPANLQVTGQGWQVKILDLGLARFPSKRNGESSTTLVSVTWDGDLIGTPDYMAPEQATRPSKVDIRADVYGLGCTLHEMIAGQPPFAGGTFMDKLCRHQREAPPALDAIRPGVPARVARTVEQMLRKRPEDRFATPGEVAAVLAQFA